MKSGSRAAITIEDYELCLNLLQRSLKVNDLNVSLENEFSRLLDKSKKHLKSNIFSFSESPALDEIARLNRWCTEYVSAEGWTLFRNRLRVEKHRQKGTTSTITISDKTQKQMKKIRKQLNLESLSNDELISTALKHFAGSKNS